MHAVTDPVAPYAGVPARGSPDYYAPAVPAWLRAWALRDACRGGPAIFLRTRAVTAQRWGGCDDGAVIAGYRLAAGGHTWPQRFGGVGGSNAISAFFAAHPGEQDGPPKGQRGAGRRDDEGTGGR